MTVGGNPVKNEEGCAFKRFEYDGQNRMKKEIYADPSGRVSVGNGNFAMIRYAYDPDRENKISRVEYLNAEGGLTLNRELGYSYVAYEYKSAPNGQGEIVVERYYDPSQNPVRVSEYGYAVMQKDYDSRGQLAKETYYDETGVRINRKDYWVSGIRYSYADDGNVIGEWYLDLNDNVTKRADTGYAAVKYSYDNGRKI